MPEAGPGTGPAEEPGWLDSLRARSEQAWQDAQAAWALAQDIQARQEKAAKGSARESRTARLEARLASMLVVEQAKGVLIAQQGCDADQAFELLCRAAHRSSLPVRELAEQIVKKAQQHEAPS
jgi:AmiR/NasT family two-component response regulator